jgi:hypothetical protein
MSKTYQHDVEGVYGGMEEAAYKAYGGKKTLHHESREENDRWARVVAAVVKIDRKTQAEGFWHQRPASDERIANKDAPTTDGESRDSVANGPHEKEGVAAPADIQGDKT